MRPRIGVGIVGAGRMGETHARAYARLGHHYRELDFLPKLVALADVSVSAMTDLASRFEIQNCYSNWRDLLADPHVDAVSITAPNGLHREVAMAAAAAGKHVWIEKPVGLTVEDARAVAAAVAEAGVHATVGFNYRNFPAVSRARRLIQDGEIGRPIHARIHLLSDSAAHPDRAFSWRFTRDLGGAGVLADLASHGIDLVRFLLGDVRSLIAETAIFLPRRPLPPRVSGTPDPSGNGRGAPSTAEVENEDYVCALLRTRRQALVILEASRVAVGSPGAFGFVVHGTAGQAAWDLRCSDKLVVSSGRQYQNQPVATVFSGPDDGDYARFQPAAAIPIGYDESIVIEAADFLRGAYGGDSRGATIEDAVRSAEALDAMVRSAATGSWVEL